jgi:hypothetical protein
MRVGETPGPEEARHALALTSTGRVFLNFGIMRPYKGIGALLDAWEAAGLGPAGHTLLLAGEFSDPAYRSEIVARAAALAGVRIDAQRIPDEKIRFSFGAADATVLPYERVLTSSSINLAIAFATSTAASTTAAKPRATTCCSTSPSRVGESNLR